MEEAGSDDSSGLGLGTARAGLSNADFARIFRQQAAAEPSAQEPLQPPAPPPPPPPPAKAPLAMSRAQLASLGQWEKHTKGFGMKMLAKMGFKGRLGKDERGVSATVEVVQRPALMGIGFGNFTEASALKHNRRLQRELRGETVEDESARLRQEADARDEDDALWRKRKAEPLAGRAKKYKRAADVARAPPAAAKRSDTVLDMRGPNVRVLDSVSDAYDADLQQQQQQQQQQPKLGDELIYNVRMVVNQAQNQICDLTAKAAQSSENLASLEKEQKIIQAQVALEKVRLQRVEAMMQRMEELEQAAHAALENRDTAGIVALLSDIRKAFPPEFEAYKLHQVVPSLCIPPLKARLVAVDFSDRDTRTAVVQQFQLIQIFLLEVPSASSGTGTGNGGSVFHNIHEKVNSAGEEMYNFVLEETLWPAVTQFVAYQWRVKEDPDACIALLEVFRPHLSTAFEAAFLHQLVLSRLKKECQRWDPQTDPEPIHDWLLPWLPYLGEGAMHSLYPDIRLALSHVLNQWHPSDLSVLAVLSPWRAVWGEHEYAKFTHRHVVRKLVRCLHRDFEVNPQKQSLEALTWVLAWQAHLPERQFIALFEGEFFPQWLRVLRRWVTADAPSLLELEKWYRGWKGFFAKQQLAEHPRLVVHFHGALVLLEAACDAVIQRHDDDNDTKGSAGIIPKLNRDAPSSYQDALVKARVEDPAAEDGDGSSNDDGARAGEFVFSSQQQQQETKMRMKKKTASHAVGMKDVVESLAIAHDVTFLPKGFHDGQQVYVFGAHHILIEQGVVFVEKTKGSFEPVDIEQLL